MECELKILCPYGRVGSNPTLGTSAIGTFTGSQILGPLWRHPIAADLQIVEVSNFRVSLLNLRQLSGTRSHLFTNFNKSF